MMRKTFVALAFAATLPALALAMPGDGRGHHHRVHSSHLAEQLDLTREQKQEMRKLMGEQMKNQHAITQRYLDKLPEAERKAMREELQKNKQDTHANLRNLLTPEQQTKFDEMHEKMEARRAERAEFLKWKAERDGKN